MRTATAANQKMIEIDQNSSNIMCTFMLLLSIFAACKNLKRLKATRLAQPRTNCSPNRKNTTSKLAIALQLCYMVLRATIVIYQYVV